MPWAWYAKANADCAVAGLFSLNYSELYRTKHGALASINWLNVPILFAIGVLLRVVSLLLLLICHRDKQGKQTFVAIVAQAILHPALDFFDDLAWVYASASAAAAAWGRGRAAPSPPATPRSRSVSLTG